MPLSSLLPNGNPNPGALNIELDIPVVLYASPENPAAYVRIWGLSLEELGHAFDLNDATIKIYGGMSKGLPLANPQQQGLLVEGTIFQAFGNWVLTEQTIDLLFNPSTGNNDTPKNIVQDWKAGTPMQSAIQNTLSTAFPDKTLAVNISGNLILPNDEPGYYASLSQYAQYLKAVSRSIVGGTSYPGVDIAMNGDTISVADGTATSGANVIQIQPQDLIGQPTWMPADAEGVTGIQVKCVMRADIHVQDLVQLPPTLVTTTGGSSPRFRDLPTFTGQYFVARVHHWGNFRQPSADSWCTVINLQALTTGDTSGSAAP